MEKKLPCKYNLKKSMDNDTDLLFRDIIDKTKIVPASADIRSCYNPIKNQSELSYCKEELEANDKNHEVVIKYKLQTINDILYCVGVLKRPVLVGVDVYASFEGIGPDGYVPMPKEDEQLLGGNAINICGYFWKKARTANKIENDIELYLNIIKYDRYFIAKSSWGESFGDEGYIYIPGNFLLKHSADWWNIDIK